MFEERGAAVDAEEDGEVLPFEIILNFQAFNFLDDAVGFIFHGTGFEAMHGFAAVCRGPECFFVSVEVVRDERGGASENGLCGAIILFEFIDSARSEHFFEPEDSRVISAAPPIDGLVVVPDGREVSLRSG